MAFNKEKTMDAARRFVDKGQLDKAIKEYLRVVREEPQDVRVWLKIGDLFARKGQKQEATETYLKVARFYQDQGFFTKAVAVYKQILKLDPRLVEVHLKLAELYRQLGLMSDAMQHFESVAAHFHREGKTKEAMATVRQLVDLDPQNVATRIKLAELYSKEGMNAEAVAEFSTVCDQLRRQNRQDDFIKVAERLLWHRPDNRDLNRELAGLYLRRNDPRRALQKLQLCFKADPRDVETLALLAQAFQALDQKGKTVSVLKELARVLDENKQTARAEEVYRKILAFAPTDPDALAYLGGAQAQQPPVAAAAWAPPPSSRLNWTGDVPALRQPGDPRMTGAMPLVDEAALSQDFELPEDEEAVPGQFDEGAGMGRAGRGPADFAADFDASDERAGSAAGEEHAEEIAKILTETDVYVKYGLHQKAIDHLRRVFALDPDNLEARERLKDVLLSQGREDEAINELLRMAESMAPIDAERAESYVREVLAIDGANPGALELTRRFGLDISMAPELEVIDGGSSDLIIDPDEINSGGVAPVEEDLDFDDIDFGEPSRPRMGLGPAGRADSFDGIDPAMFDRATSRPGSGGRAGSPRAVGSEHDFSPHAENTRQVAASEVEALVARSTRDAPDDIAMGSPPPFRPGSAAPDTVQQPRSLRDAIDAELDDALAEDIDEQVAAELGGYPSDYAVADDLPPDDLPFDPAAAREFDSNMRRHATSGTDSSQPPTFDPGAAAAFDSERDAYVNAAGHDPAAADVGAQALPAGTFDTPYPGAGYSTTEDEAPAFVDPSYQPGYEHDPRYAAPGYDAEAGYPQQAGYDPQQAGYDPQQAGYDPQQPGYDAQAGYAQQAGYDPQQGYDDPYYQGGAVEAPMAAIDSVAAARRTLEDDLEDADYFAGQGMYAEAAELLRGQLASHPGHPLIEARLRDLDAHLAQYGGAAVSAETLADVDVEPDAIVSVSPAPAQGGTETVDVDDLLELEAEEIEIDGDDDVAAAFDEAQRVIAGEPDSVRSRPAVVLENPVEDSDADTHFDLGLAYKEMGLYDEAIKAFDKVTSTSRTREVQSRMMIGLCHREQGNLSEAVHQFKAGLHAAAITDRERQTLYYEIGTTYESLGDPREAIYYFEMVIKRDPNFLDVAARLERLRGSRRRGHDDTGDAIDSLLADDH